MVLHFGNFLALDKQGIFAAVSGAVAAKKQDASESTFHYSNREGLRPHPEWKGAGIVG